MFCKKGVHTNFAKFTGKHLCQRLFFNKVAGLRPETLLKKSFWHRCFSVNFAKFLKTPFFNRAPPVAASEPTDCLWKIAATRPSEIKSACNRKLTSIKF